MPEGEKLWGPVVIGGDNLPSLVRIRLTDLPNIVGGSGPTGPPGSGITASTSSKDHISFQNFPRHNFSHLLLPKKYLEFFSDGHGSISLNTIDYLDKRFW